MAEAVKKIKEAKESRVAHQLPDPKGWKILVALPEVKTQTEGGIYMPDSLSSAEHTASIVGCVLKLGPLAYGDENKFPTGPWCKEGDWIVMRSYSGTRIRVHDQELRLINDDTGEAVVEDPRGVARA